MRWNSWSRLVALIGLCAVCLSAGAQPQPPAATTPEKLQAERRVRLAKLWGEIRFRHPWAFSKPAEWDAAFLAALPKVEAARDTQAYASAVQDMLAVLRDSATLVERERDAPSGPAPTLRAPKSWEKDILVLDLRHLAGPQGRSVLPELQKTLAEEAAKARAVVLDLRMRGIERYGAATVVPRLLPQLIEGELSVPGLRSVLHSGLRPQDGSPNVYRTEFMLEAEQIYTGTPGKKPRLLVFLVDGDSVVDPSLLALRARGKALLVAEGPITDGSTVTQEVVALGEGLEALVRLNETVLPFEADVVLPARARMDGPDEGLRKALALASRPPKPQAGKAVATKPAAGWRPEPSYEDQLYPSREMRLLAATKLWTVVRFFFPYQHLMERPWEPRLPELLDKLAAAKDARQYALALAEAGTWLQDGHVRVQGHPELQSLWGTGAAVVLTDIDGKAVVLEVLAPEAAPGLAVGDVIEKVDGESIEARAQRLAPYITGSTPAALRDRALQRTLSGAAGSTVTLGVRGAQGPKEVKLTRDMRFFQRRMAPSGKEPYRVLEGNIGFVDLGKLSAAQVPEMYEKLKDTRGIVFDLRNYPNFSMWALGPYFDVKGQRPFAWYEMPLVGSALQGQLKSVEAVPEQAVPKYRGRTVTLIDGRAISHAEHTGLMLEAAADTLFLGSPTAGANGNITTAVLPGGVQLIFTGLDVRHGDGRQLQRKGLEPHIKLRPTVAGLQAGRDELLERAIQILREQPGSKAADRAP